MKSRESGNYLEFSFRYKHLLCLSSTTVFRQSLFLNILQFLISLLLCVKSLQILQANYCRAANKVVVVLTLLSSICSHTCSKGRSHPPCPISTTCCHPSLAATAAFKQAGSKPDQGTDSAENLAQQQKFGFLDQFPEPAHPAAPQICIQA